MGERVVPEAEGTGEALGLLAHEGGQQGGFALGQQLAAAVAHQPGHRHGRLFLFCCNARVRATSGHHPDREEPCGAPELAPLPQPPPPPQPLEASPPPHPPPPPPQHESCAASTLGAEALLAAFTSAGASALHARVVVQSFGGEPTSHSTIAWPWFGVGGGRRRPVAKRAVVAGVGGEGGGEGELVARAEERVDRVRKVRLQPRQER